MLGKGLAGTTQIPEGFVVEIGNHFYAVDSECNETMSKSLDTRRMVFFGSLVATFLLYKLVPSIAGPLILLATFVHETGHGIAAILVGGEFRELHMTDWGGYATVAHSGSGISSAVVSAGGLVGPSVAAMLSFVAARKPKFSRIFLGSVALLIVWLIVFKISNGRGYVVAAVILAGAALVALKGSDSLNQTTTIFFGVQLALSLYAHRQYLFTDYFSVGSTRMSSDTQNMSDALIGPYYFWAVVCIAVSLIALAVGAYVLLSGAGKPGKTNAAKLKTTPAKPGSV